MSGELTVRRAGPEDAELLRDVLARAFAEYEGALDPPSGVLAETAGSLREKVARGGALVCEGADGALGCALYMPEADHLYVGRVGVVPEGRRGGAGAALLRAAERRALELGYGRVRLNVRLALGRLRAYYESRGYRPIACHAHEGSPEPTYVEMEKVLPAGGG